MRITCGEETDEVADVVGVVVVIVRIEKTRQNCEKRRKRFRWLGF